MALYLRIFRTRIEISPHEDEKRSNSRHVVPKKPEHLILATPLICEVAEGVSGSFALRHRGTAE
jgi:hypothetical protein